MIVNPVCTETKTEYVQKSCSRLFLAGILMMLSFSAHGGETSTAKLDLTTHFSGYLAIAIFVFAYVLVFFEEKLKLQKSKPVLVAAGIIWAIIAFVYTQYNLSDSANQAVKHYFLEYSELFFFLMVAMTYVNAMIERGVFEALRHRLVSSNLSFRQVFWLTGIVTFFISPVADNLTAALIMCTVVLTVGSSRSDFTAIACVNVVVAANAGGAFSPFGDITTLMVWQKGVLEFWTFFKLFIPSVLNFIVPATIMYFYLPKDHPQLPDEEEASIRHGGIVIVLLFMATIATSIIFHQYLHLPAAFGMLMGLGYLKMFGHYLRIRFRQEKASFDMIPGSEPSGSAFDVFSHVAKSEWDTLFFFYGVIMSVGGLAFMGYLGNVSEFMYGELGATTANILVGVLSAVIDNIPIMFAVLTMQPDMPDSQWLLVTLTAGVGGSLLSIGSAAGVALMGQARGVYTFLTHLKWLPAIALGYFCSIFSHLLMNG